MTIRMLFAAAAALAIAGCASGPPPAPLLVDAKNQTLAPPPADKAQIVFLEPINAIQGMFPVGVYEVHGSERTLLAQLASHTKSVQLVTPGHHVFASNPGGVAHIMEADVAAGKRYYVLMRFIYAQGMQLRPIRPTGPSDFSVANKDFAEWVSITRFVDKTAAADEHEKKFDTYLVKAQAEAQADWLKKTPAQRAELTLNVGDAIDR